MATANRLTSRLANISSVVVDGHRQAFDIAFGQHLQWLLAHQQSDIAHMQSFFAFGLKCFELQAQTFGQVARAHTHRLEALQQMQGHLETLFEFFQLLFIVTGQAFGQTAQAVFEVTVVVEVFNQET